MIYNFTCNKSKYDADDRDADAILCLRNIFNHTDTKLDEKTDKFPNIDGYIELLNSEGLISGKVTIQVKCYPKANRNLSKYSIPAYILGYAERMKGEIVLFITADLDEKKIYWKYLDSDYILECVKKGIQGEYIYHFKDVEIITSDNVTETIEKWKELYDEKMSLIKEKSTLVYEKINKLSLPFCIIKNYFYGLTDSYIERKELIELYDWINSPLKEKSNIALLIGSAGVGKSVVLKQLIQKLYKNKIPYMALKVDCSDISGSEKGDGLSEICEDFGYLTSYKDKAILIIDQIDALSQSLSNDRRILMNYLALILLSLRKE